MKHFCRQIGTSLVRSVPPPAHTAAASRKSSSVL